MHIARNESTRMKMRMIEGCVHAVSKMIIEKKH